MFLNWRTGLFSSQPEFVWKINEKYITCSQNCSMHPLFQVSFSQFYLAKVFETWYIKAGKTNRYNPTYKEPFSYGNVKPNQFFSNFAKITNFTQNPPEVLLIIWDKCFGTYKHLKWPENRASVPLSVETKNNSKYYQWKFFIFQYAWP